MALGAGLQPHRRDINPPPLGWNRSRFQRRREQNWINLVVIVLILVIIDEKDQNYLRIILDWQVSILIVQV
jgi:hypothetical protein